MRLIEAVAQQPNAAGGAMSGRRRWRGRPQRGRPEIRNAWTAWSALNKSEMGGRTMRAFGGVMASRNGSHGSSGKHPTRTPLQFLPEVYHRRQIRQTKPEGLGPENITVMLPW